jgi:hypothetical protein
VVSVEWGGVGTGVVALLHLLTLLMNQASIQTNNIYTTFCLFWQP